MTAAQSPSGAFPIPPPVEPMLAKLADTLPAGEFLFEPKWDGFRAIVFRGRASVFMQSRDLRPLDRYFPELHEALLAQLPDTCVVDGEIVIKTPNGLDFDALQLRLHPAASRVAKLAKEIPASFVAFDLLAADGGNRMAAPQRERRMLLERLLADVRPPIYLTPMTRDREVAAEWLEQFEGAGLDGVVAKPADAPYQPGKRAMVKVKHARTADCVVAGFRWYKTGRDAVGSLLLGLYDDQGALQHVGVTSSFTQGCARAAARECAGGSSVAGMGAGGGGQPRPDAGRPEPVERRQGSLMGAPARGTRLRGTVRPPSGRSLPPRGELPALAPRQAATRLSLRSTRSDASL
jgi:ATP-dependent DNA ligase